MLIKLDKQLKVIVMIALSLVAPPGWADTLYKSVGPDGKVIYSDKPPSDGQIEKIVEYAPDPSSPLPDYVPRFKPELEKRLQQQATKAPASAETVRLFTAAWCGFCRKAKAYLTKQQVAFTEYNVETPEGLEALASIGGGHGVPILFWRGKKVYGFSEAGYETFLSG